MTLVKAVYSKQLAKNLRGMSLRRGAEISPRSALVTQIDPGCVAARGARQQGERVRRIGMRSRR